LALHPPFHKGGGAWRRDAPRFRRRRAPPPSRMPSICSNSSSGVVQRTPRGSTASKPTGVPTCGARSGDRECPLPAGHARGGAREVGGIMKGMHSEKLQRIRVVLEWHLTPSAPRVSLVHTDRPRDQAPGPPCPGYDRDGGRASGRHSSMRRRGSSTRWRASRALMAPASRRRALAGAFGRWNILRRGDRPTPDAGLLARQLLRRTDVVMRKVIAREKAPVPWRDLARVYRTLEARGDVRGGRFVAGFSGEQFALPEAVPLLRDIRRRGGSSTPGPRRGATAGWGADPHIGTSMVPGTPRSTRKRETPPHLPSYNGSWSIDDSSDRATCHPLPGASLRARCRGT
jgi:hypothetical protein